MRLFASCLALFFLTAGVLLADEEMPRLEPEKMRGLLALHGGGEISLEVARAFRKLGRLPGRKLKLYAPGQPVSDAWHKVDFEMVDSAKDAEATWIGEKPEEKEGAELLAFLKRGGLVGLSGAAVTWFDSQGGLPRTRALLTGEKVLELSMETPLAYRLSEGAGLFFSGRSIVAVGESTEVFGLKNHRRKISPRRRADHFALVRASLSVIVDADFPRPELPLPHLKRGKLVLIGGGATPGGALREFIDSAGGKDGHIVVIPTAEGDKPDEEQRIVPVLRERGAGKVTVLHAWSLKEADSAEFARQLDSATGVWFGGGRQWRLVDRYFGTKTHDALNALLERGGVISGTSAGATICGEYLVRGDPLGSKTMMAPGYERALNFLPGVAIDQHFTQRGRFPDMVALKNRYPQFFGIGLDEATAISVSGGVLSVIGRGNVYLYPTRDPKNRVDLKSGDQYSFSERKVLPKPEVSPFE